MERGILRDRVEEAVDTIENEINSILENLRMVEDKACLEVELLDHEEIGGLQHAIIEATKALKDLADALY